MAVEVKKSLATNPAMWRGDVIKLVNSMGCNGDHDCKGAVWAMSNVIADAEDEDGGDGGSFCSADGQGVHDMMLFISQINGSDEANDFSVF